MSKRIPTRKYQVSAKLTGADEDYYNDTSYHAISSERALMMAMSEWLMNVMCDGMATPKYMNTELLNGNKLRLEFREKFLREPNVVIFTSKEN